MIKAKLLDDGSVVEVLSHGSTRPMEGGSDWQRLDALSDEQITAAIKDDPDAAPALDAERLHEARAIAEAEALVDAGQGIPHEKVREWLLKLAEGKVVPPPCK